jgi:hypothetical protein
MSMTIKKTIRFVVAAHENQFYGAAPYIVHPYLVARRFSNEKLIKIALLHDVVEDTRVTLDQVKELFGDEISEAVDAITRREGENYDEYIERVCLNRDAARVKICDLEENINSGTFMYPGEYDQLIERWRPALRKVIESVYPNNNDDLQG